MEDGVLTISGTGEMADYIDDDLSWKAFSHAITSVVIESGVTAIGDYAFYDCPLINEVTIPATVGSIGDYAFYGNQVLDLVEIPNSVKTIGEYAFSDCFELAWLFIGPDVTDIGQHAFDGCDALAMITSFAIIPPPCGNECFKYVNRDIPVYVPAKSVQAYKDADVWKEFDIQPLPLCTVTWRNWDGSLLAEEQYEYNIYDLPSYKGDQPIRPATAEYTYTFTGWTPEIEPLTDDVTYTAVYQQNFRRYNVAFFDWDGTTLYEAEYYYDETPEYPFGNPNRQSTAQYDFTFTGWSPQIENVSADQSYTALYEQTLRTYTVAFLDWDGTTLYVNEYDYGNIPEYPYDDPERESTVATTFTFAGWTPEISKVTDDATYTALYNATAQTYTVTFLDKDGNVINVQDVVYGEAAVAPEAPEVDGYTFTGWDKAFNNVTADLTVKALYEEAPDLTPTNLNVQLTPENDDMQITLSWDKTEGAVSYELRVVADEQELFSQNTMTLNLISRMLSDIVNTYKINPGTYTMTWFVRSIDVLGHAISGWAEGPQFEITVKGEATGVEEVPSDKVQGKKVFINGQIFILRGDATYTVQGQKVR